MHVYHISHYENKSAYEFLPQCSVVAHECICILKYRVSSLHTGDRYICKYHILIQNKTTYSYIIIKKKVKKM